ncbi:MAG: AarF/UbiB family protein [Anaerosomatales bacterium]|nr:AarF/UbiB family protein [Anaerosomatales bacterium]
MASRGTHIAGVVARRLAAAALRSAFGLRGRGVWRRESATAWRLAFEELGPAFIKLGQLISVRPDEFSDELVAEMQSMQDAVPALPAPEIRAVIRSEFGREPEDLWDGFEDEPIASASIAQVHRARLKRAYRPVWGEELPAGARVAVKVIRPGAAEAIRADVAVARRLAERAVRLGLVKRFDPVALLDEFAESVERELDMRVEGRFADRFAFDFRDDPVVQAPRIVWPLTGRRVLTMEFIEGWRLTEVDAVLAEGVDFYGLAVHGAEAFMRQVFVYGRYHADLHPANVFVTPENRIAYLDFGIVGYLTPEERYNITQVMAALVYRDPDRALAYSEKLGVHVPPEKVPAVRAELGKLLDALARPGEAADEQSSFAHFGYGFLRLLGRHGIEIPSGYGMLIKSLATVEGCSRMLYPDIDIIGTTQPFTTRVLARALADPAVLRERLPEAVRAALRVLVA